MEQIFDAILGTSLSGGVIILVVLALRLVLKNTPKRFICLLWLLAMVRLLLPFSIESPLSLQPDPDRLSALRPEHSVVQEEIPADPMVPADPAVTPAVTTPGGSSAPDYDVVIGDTVMAHPDIVTIDTAAIYAGVWAVVACGFLLYTAASYVLLRRKVRDAVPVVEGIYECAAIDAPFLLGYFRPRIYLPVGLPLQDLDFILAHEQAHIRRLDNWTKLLGFLCLALHWFNPLVWAAYILLCRDMEMACDEQVVRNMSAADRKAYSGALLNCAAGHRLVSACPVAFGEVSVKQRILKVLNYRRPAFWISIIAVIAIVFVAVCFLTSPITPAEPTGIEWLHQLQAEDVASVKFTVCENPLSYTEYDDSELQWIISLLRSCDATEKGRGWSFVTDNRYFYITMRDGSVHRVGICTHDGNTVEIDGILYTNCYEWISRLPTEGEVKVDMLDWAMNSIRESLSAETVCLHVDDLSADPFVPAATYRRNGADWIYETDISGSCVILAEYDGKRYRMDQTYAGNHNLVSTTDWYVDSSEEPVVFPWPLDGALDPADWVEVESEIYIGNIDITLRYEPDGTLLTLFCVPGFGPNFTIERPDGSMYHFSFSEPNSVGTAWLVEAARPEAAETHAATQRVLDYTTNEMFEKCRTALETLQNSPAYSLVQQDHVEIQDGGTHYFWKSGDDWYFYSKGNTDIHYLEKDGAQFCKGIDGNDKWTAVTDAELPEYWLARLEWDTNSIFLLDSSKEYHYATLTVLDEQYPLGYYELEFQFDEVTGEISSLTQVYRYYEQGELVRHRNLITLYENPPESVSAYIDARYREAIGE